MIPVGAVILVSFALAVAVNVYVTVTVPSAFFVTLVAFCPFTVAVTPDANS